jgi:hypothetical protein
VRNTTLPLSRPAAYARGGMHDDAIMVEVEPEELRETEPGVVDVFDALGRQFFWADVVMVAARDSDADVLVGEVVYTPG